MNNRIKDMYVLVMYILAFAGLILIVVSHIDSFWLYLFITLCWLFSFTVRNLFIYKTDKYKKYALVTYIAEFLLLFLLDLLGAGNSVKLLFCITTADCYIAWNAGLGTAFAVLAFSLYAFPLVANKPVDAKMLLTVFADESPAFLLTGLVAYLLGRVLKSNALVEKTVKETQLREIELKTAYDELSKAYRNLEEMAALKERNRIAREIHDTVGHTMTTVIVELEAGMMLAGTDTVMSMEKFRMAQEQASKGLNELRRSVRLLSEDYQSADLKQRLMDAIDETERHAGVTVKYDITIPEGLKNGYGDLIVRALKEGIANGIRHGGGTAFFFKLAAENDRLSFLLQDNGKGCNSIIPGFGLKSMKEGVENTGGRIVFNSEQDNGFEIEMDLPLR